MKMEDSKRNKRKDASSKVKQKRSSLKRGEGQNKIKGGRFREKSKPHVVVRHKPGRKKPKKCDPGEVKTGRD